MSSIVRKAAANTQSFSAPHGKWEKPKNVNSYWQKIDGMAWIYEINVFSKCCSLYIKIVQVTESYSKVQNTPTLFVRTYNQKRQENAQKFNLEGNK